MIEEFVEAVLSAAASLGVKSQRPEVRKASRAVLGWTEEPTGWGLGKQLAAMGQDTGAVLLGALPR